MLAAPPAAVDDAVSNEAAIRLKGLVPHAPGYAMREMERRWKGKRRRLRQPQLRRKPCERRGHVAQAVQEQQQVWSV